MFISTKYHTGNNHWTYIRLQNNNCRYFHRYGFGFWQRPFFNHPVLMEKGDVFHYQKDGVGPRVESSPEPIPHNQTRFQHSTGLKLIVIIYTFMTWTKASPNLSTSFANLSFFSIPFLLIRFSLFINFTCFSL